jgi:hypothetical protein
MNEVHVPLDPFFFMLVVSLKKDTFPFTKNKLIKPCKYCICTLFVWMFLSNVGQKVTGQKVTTDIFR